MICYTGPPYLEEATTAAADERVSIRGEVPPLGLQFWRMEVWRYRKTRRRGQQRWDKLQQDKTRYAKQNNADQHKTVIGTYTRALPKEYQRRLTRLLHISYIGKQHVNSQTRAGRARPPPPPPPTSTPPPPPTIMLTHATALHLILPLLQAPQGLLQHEDRALHVGNPRGILDKPQPHAPRRSRVRPLGVVPGRYTGLNDQRRPGNVHQRRENREEIENHLL